MVISGKEHVFDFIDESDVYEKEPLVQSDKDFDDISHQLVSLQEQLQDIEDQTTYGYMMFDCK